MAQQPNTFAFLYRVPTAPGGNTYAWSVNSNWEGKQAIGNYGTPVAARIPGLPGHPHAVSLDDYGAGTIVSLYRVNVNTGKILELGTGSQLALDQGNTSGPDNLSGNMLNQGTLILDNNSALELRTLDQATGNTGTYDFDGTNATIYLTRPAGESTLPTVANFGLTDSLILEGPHVSQGYTAWSAVDTSGTLEVFGTQAGTGTLVYQLDHFSTAAGATGLEITQLTSGTDLIGNSLVNSLQLEAVCFVAGTRIETDHGPVAVESLRPGDLVRTVARGEPALTPVRWVGERTVSFGSGTDNDALHPVRIRAGALADGMPQRDLLVSGNHCLLLEDRLVPAKLLINGASILVDRTAPSIRYLHIELDGHDAVLAEGVPAETYIDVDNRTFFSNAAVTTLTPALPAPEQMLPWQARLCAPLCLHTQDVDTIWQAITDRTSDLGLARPAPALTRDPDMRLAVAGRTIRPTARNGRSTTFVLPSASSELRILSRSAVPAELDRHTNDWRRLGVRLSKIVLRSGARQVVIPADHPSLTTGWHKTEHDGPTCWRWTAGDAVLTLPPGMRGGPLTVELHNTDAVLYPMEQQREQRAA